MSTVVDTIAGKGRGLGSNFWIAALVTTLVVFGANTGYAGWKAARLGGASTAASSLQVNSQRLANQGREAVAGDAGAFAAFRQTKAEIDGAIQQLNANFGDTAGVAGPIRTVTETWTPLAASAEQIAASEQAVSGFAANAGSFTQAVPQLQAQLHELVRAMSSSGSRPRRSTSPCARTCSPATWPAAWPRSRPAVRWRRSPATRWRATWACSSRCSRACAKATRTSTCRP